MPLKLFVKLSKFTESMKDFFLQVFCIIHPSNFLSDLPYQIFLLTQPSVIMYSYQTLTKPTLSVCSGKCREYITFYREVDHCCKKRKSISD